MTNKKTKGITRHDLKYAWIEFGSPLDGAAFAAGMKKLGLKSVLKRLPPEKNKKAQKKWLPRRVDSAHPLLPIRRRCGALMILPDEIKGKSKKYVRDPIFNAYLRTHTDDEFNKEIRKQNDFLSSWIFSPGVKISGKKGSEKGMLTLDSDYTDYADIVGVGGHGSNGLIWGEGEGIELRNSIWRAHAHTDRLKYIIIATCFHLSEFNLEIWLPAMRRRNPVHGFLGYRWGYPGAKVGRNVFNRFTKKLKEKRGTKTILDAWREANSGSLRQTWAALLHHTSAKDTMKDWMCGRLTTPNKDGEIRWYCEENWSDGEKAVPREYDYTANFYMGTTKISRDNNFGGNKDVGLFSGEKGYLEIAKKKGGFNPGEEFATIVFYYYRERHDPGMDLPKLLDFGKPKDGRVKFEDGVLKYESDLNKKDKYKFTDGFEFTFWKSKVTKANVPWEAKVQLPFKVNPKAHENFENAGPNRYGYFWLMMRVSHAQDRMRGLRGRPIPCCLEGTWLRGPRPKKASTP